MVLKEIIDCLEAYAPSSYQESYDNSGLIVGDPRMEVNAAMISLDATPAVIQDAIDKGVNLLISHHPIVFKGLKRFNGSNYVEKAVMLAIKNDIALYAIHTNLDNVKNGVNGKIADLLGLEHQQILSPKREILSKLVVFVPTQNTGQLLDALYAAGAGEIGNYTNCSFRVEGKGTFKPNENATPHTGSINIYEEVDENRIEVIFPKYMTRQILAGMKKGHVYEEIAHYLTDLQNDYASVGSGMVGDLKNEMPVQEFLQFLKTTMNCEVIRHTDVTKNNIKRVAVCGGSGGFLLNDAKSAKADIFITSDYKYHEFFDADGDILIADIGHYESEQYTKDLIQDIISKKIPNFATYLSDVKTNPVSYFY